MYGKEIEKVLITNDDVRNRLKEVAKKIGDDYKGKDVLFICVLRGAFMFFADLVREISEYDVNAQVDFIAVSSYGEGTVSTGEVYQRLLDADCGQKRNHRRRYRGHGHHSQLP